MENVSRHLLRIAELSRVTADAVADRNDHLVVELDKQFEEELGRKSAPSKLSPASRRTRLLIGCGSRSRPPGAFMYKSSDSTFFRRIPCRGHPELRWADRSVAVRFSLGPC
jgi:hypothetical protein